MRASLSSKVVVMTIIFVTGSGRPAPGQTSHVFAVNLTQGSVPGSPIVVSAGQVKFTEKIYPDRVETSWAVHAQLLNASSKPILAFELSVHAVPDHGQAIAYVSQQDYFFKENLAPVPGSQFSLDVDDQIRGVLHLKASPSPGEARTPKANLRVIFVEFADGSNYGTSDWGKNLKEGRAATVERMNELLQAYQSGGEGALRTTIARDLAAPDTPPYTVNALRILDHVLSADGVEGLALRIEEQLRVAQERLNVM